METLKCQSTELRNAFDEEDKFTVVMMLEDHVAGYEKEIWFLKSITK